MSGYTGATCSDNMLSKIADFYRINADDNCDDLGSQLTTFNQLACQLQKRGDCNDIAAAATSSAACSKLKEALQDEELVASALGVIPAGASACGCAAGLTGVACDVDIDECSSFPCVHGLCVDGLERSKLDSYSCSCTNGWSGDNCAGAVDECASTPCKNDGICVDFVGDYSCKCHAGFEGGNCQVNSQECESVPCDVHGQGERVHLPMCRGICWRHVRGHD